MKKLSEVEKETLLIRVLSQGRGSVEYARDLLTGANDPECKMGVTGLHDSHASVLALIIVSL